MKEAISKLRIRKIKLREAHQERNRHTLNAKSAKSSFRLIATALMFALLEAQALAFLVNRSLFASSSVFVLFPNATVPLAVGLLFGAHSALLAGFVSSIIIAALNGFNFGIFLTAFSATLFAAFYAPKIIGKQQLTTLWLKIAAVQIFFAITTILLPMILLHGKEWSEALWQLCAYGLAIFAAGILFPALSLPLAEFLSKHQSTITLSRFANLEHPLLRRLSLEAPGTYHHSMMVGDLAQAAADAIGANAILARTGAYYHDIGKLGKPLFYMENQSGLSNPHDQLPPNISRMIIMNHVKEGLVLARMNRLPEAIQRIITIHHGTSPVMWFYMKQRRRDKECGLTPQNDTSVEAFFRYNGSLPVTREETIVSLADSIEAASRSLKVFDKAAIASLVENIIRDKWIDGQLDKSILSQSELAQAKAAFTATLVHLLHGRLPYPQQNANSGN